MLNRHSSMTLHQPIMPFKWRPFDLYNDIHISRLNENNACGATATTSNCVRCQSNCDHLVLWGNFRKHRQSSRGSSSGSSCASLSTTSHCIGDADSGSSMSTTKSKSNASFDYHRKLVSQRDSNYDKLRFPHHRQRAGSCACFNGATINCCCGSNCQNIVQNRTTMYNDNIHCRSSNSVLAVPFANTEQTGKCGQPTCSPDRCENPPTIAVPNVFSSCNNPVNGINNGPFDNWNSIDSSKSPADSKYSILNCNFTIGLTIYFETGSTFFHIYLHISENYRMKKKKHFVYTSFFSFRSLSFFLFVFPHLRIQNGVRLVN